MMRPFLTPHEARKRWGAKLQTGGVAKTFVMFDEPEGRWQPMFNSFLDWVGYKLDEPDLLPCSIYRVKYLGELGGYVVYRHCFDEAKCSVAEGAAAHKQAVFVDEIAAVEYCQHRNQMIDKNGTDELPAATPPRQVLHPLSVIEIEMPPSACCFPNGDQPCRCHRRLGNDFWFLPGDRCLWDNGIPPGFVKRSDQ